MIDPKRFKSNLFSINDENFEVNTLKVFYYQWHNNLLYQSYCSQLNKDTNNVKKLEDIPFLPIEFFKSNIIKTGEWDHKCIYRSSGTTGLRSSHYIRDEAFYHQVSKHIYESRIGDLTGTKILALLPSYLEQGESSLISMVKHFMQTSALGGDFFLSNYDELLQELVSTTPKLLIGVSYALLDFIDINGKLTARNTIVMETGGMKGRKKELIREELHQLLMDGLGVDIIYSEYGMTELYSQAYAKTGAFSLPNWSKAIIRDINDPFQQLPFGKTGGINIIDLANIDTISFVETKDIGRLSQNGTFEVLGRFDNADLRGCNLMI